MNKIPILSLVFISIISLGNAQKNKLDFNISNFYEVNMGHSYIEFSVLYMGYAKVKGRFADFDGMFRYDENDLSKTSISLSIKTESIDTDNDWRDNDLKSDAWLAVEKFRQISFQSTRVIKSTEGFDIVGNLTIRDSTKEVTIKMNRPSGVLIDTRGDSQVIFTGNVSINRTDYGVEGKRWSKIKEGIAGVGSNVAIEVSILGKRMNAKNLSGWFRNEERSHSKIYKVLNDSGTEEAVKTFRELKKSDERVSVKTLGLVGQLLLRTGRPKEALKIFRENAKAFPNEAMAYNSLGEGFAENGDLKNAKIAFQKALTLDIGNIKAFEILRHLK